MSSHSWEASSYSASQEILHLLWNPKVHYHIHTILPLVHILSRMKPVHTLPTYKLTPLEWIFIDI
jgi:hypothetical protein